MPRRKIGKAQEGERGTRQTGGGAGEAPHCKQIRTGKLPVRENEHGEIDGGGGGRNAGVRQAGGRLSGIADRGTE